MVSFSPLFPKWVTVRIRMCFYLSGLGEKNKLESTTLLEKEGLCFILFCIPSAQHIIQGRVQAQKAISNQNN